MIKIDKRFFQIFFWFCLLWLIPGLLVRLPIGGSGVLATDVIVPLYAFTWLGFTLLIKRKVPNTRFILPALLFTVFASITFVWGAWDLLLQEQILSFAYIVRFISIAIFGWSAMELFQTEKEKNQFWYGLFGICGIVAILGFLQFWLIPDIGQWSKEGEWDPHTGRLLGTWMDPNFVSGFMGLIMPMVAAKFYDSKDKIIKTILFFLFCMFGVALFLTFSRSGYLAAATGLGLFFFFRDARVIVIGIIVISIGVAASPRAQQRLTGLAGTFSTIILQDTDEVDPTANLRIESWRKSFTLFEKYPLTGIGYNTYRYTASEEGIVDPNFYSAGGSDSTLLNILITTGIFGFLLFCWFYGRLWIGSCLTYFKTKQTVYLGYTAALTSIIIHSFFVNSILFPFIFLVIMAVGGVLEKKD